MIVKIGQVMNAVTSLNNLVEQKMSASTAFRLSRLITKIQEAMKPYNEIYTKMVNKYGILDEEKQLYKIDKEHMESFTKESNDLHNEIVDLGDIVLIKESDLEECQLTPIDASNISILVESK